MRRLLKVLLFVCLFVLGVLPAHPVAARVVIVVADLEPSGVAEHEAATVSEMVRVRLLQHPEFVVVERAQMEAVLEEQKFSLLGCTETGCAIELGRLLSAEKVLVGRVSRFLGRLVTAVRLVDLARGEVEAVEEVSCSEDFSSMEQALGELARRLAQRYPVAMRLTGKDGDTWFLNGASAAGLQPAQRVDVVRESSIVDETGKTLGQELLKVGVVEILSAGAAVGRARQLSGDIRVGDILSLVPPVHADFAVSAAGTGVAVANMPSTVAGSEVDRCAEPSDAVRAVYVPGGVFSMGDSTALGAFDERPAHRVEVSAFCLGQYEVTQAEWEREMGGNPSFFKGPDLPVENVSWQDAMRFLQRLSERHGRRYRLPTEAEWEYAARGGGGKGEGSTWAGASQESELPRFAWYLRTSGGKTRAVGQKAPNRLGLYDMTGNVWEWCADWYADAYYASSPPKDPAGPDSGRSRVMRGGSWAEAAKHVRASNRDSAKETYRHYTLGLRVARDVE